MVIGSFSGSVVQVQISHEVAGLEGFQECVECLSGKHVNFINNVCLVFAIRASQQRSVAAD